MNTNKVIGISIGIIIFTTLFVGIFFTSISPLHISFPKSTHSHFRLQIWHHGEQINFSDETFQTPYNPLVCDQNITETPIHFHDSQKEIVHLHWKGITGYDVLKNYGWNNNAFNLMKTIQGIRFDEFPHIHVVHSQKSVLPEVKDDEDVFIFIKRGESISTLTLKEFLKTHLESYFMEEYKTKNNMQEHMIPDNTPLGDVLILIQSNAPTNEEVQQYLSNFHEEMSRSCNG